MVAFPPGDFNPTAAYEPLVERSYPLSVNLPPDMSCQLNIASTRGLAVYLLKGDDLRGAGAPMRDFRAQRVSDHELHQ